MRLAINLGLVPQALTVTLAAGGDFVCALVASTDWPVGTGIELHLSGGTETPVVWDATITGARAEWEIDTADVADVIASKVSEARLHYVEADGTRLVWAEGSVRVR